MMTIFQTTGTYEFVLILWLDLNCHIIYFWGHKTLKWRMAKWNLQRERPFITSRLVGVKWESGGGDQKCQNMHDVIYEQHVPEWKQTTQKIRCSFGCTENTPRSIWSNLVVVSRLNVNFFSIKKIIFFTSRLRNRFFCPQLAWHLSTVTSTE